MAGRVRRVRRVPRTAVLLQTEVAPREGERGMQRLAEQCRRVCATVVGEVAVFVGSSMDR